MTTTTVTGQDPNRIQPWHEAHDEDKTAALTESMSANGRVGAPIVTIAGRDHGWGPGDAIAVNGSHRIAAARDAGIAVPTVHPDVLVSAHGRRPRDPDEP